PQPLLLPAPHLRFRHRPRPLRPAARHVRGVKRCQTCRVRHHTGGHAMASRIVDISAALRGDIASDPPGMEPKIAYVGHRESAQTVCAFFPGLAPADLPDGEGWAIEQVQITTHNGTHLDAPWHFASTMDGGERAITIDERSEEHTSELQSRENL